jgi:acetyl esterase/lipase
LKIKRGRSKTDRARSRPLDDSPELRRDSMAFAQLILAACLTTGFAADDVQGKEITLWPVGMAPGSEGVTAKEKVDQDHISNVHQPSITVYLPPKEKANGASVVICPGGGHRFLAIQHEGHDVAKWLNEIGVAAFVLKYRLAQTPNFNYKVETHSLQDAQRAIRLVRSKSKEWNLDPKRVGIMGFSAGGHLASTTGTHLEKPDENAPDPIARQSSRPDFMVLVYPVITFEGPSAHTGSRNNLIGKDADEKMVELYSNEKQVTKETPPTLLVHAADDPVKVENSRLFFDALREKKIPCEFLEFGSGGHGFGLGNGSRGAGATAAWPAQCIAWLHSQKFLDAK